jgi:hypothetical protein
MTTHHSRLTMDDKCGQPKPLEQEVGSYTFLPDPGGREHFKNFIMKNKWITRHVIGFCLLLFAWTGYAQTTSLEVGAVKNGVGTITSMANATRVLLSNLPEGATVSEIQLEYSEYDNRYYLTAKVSNNSISSVAIQLTTTGSTIAAFAGPGLEVTCTGLDCGTCRPIISKWEPRCDCKNPTSPHFKCDMTSKVVLTL